MSLDSGSGNTSGQPGSALPAEVQGLNWGAFLLNWIWCIPHKAWLGLILSLCCSPAGMIYLLIKGNELAWQNRQFSGVDEFKAVQSAWLKWGLILLAVSVVLSVIGGIMGVILGAAAGGMRSN
jgi:hypothetical protein